MLIGDLYNTLSTELSWRYFLQTGIDGSPVDEPSPDGSQMNGVSSASCAYIRQPLLLLFETVV
jgi:hypothetical protein